MRLRHWTTMLFVAKKTLNPTRVKRRTSLKFSHSSAKNPRRISYTMTVSKKLVKKNDWLYHKFGSNFSHTTLVQLNHGHMLLSVQTAGLLCAPQCTRLTYNRGLQESPYKLNNMPHLTLLWVQPKYGLSNTLSAATLSPRPPCYRAFSLLGTLCPFHVCKLSSSLIFSFFFLSDRANPAYPCTLNRPTPDLIEHRCICQWWNWYSNEERRGDKRRQDGE